MGFWLQLAFYVVTLALSVALAPKPPRNRPATLEDFELPTAEEDRPVPILFGTKRITGPNVLWFGDLSVSKLKKSSLFGSQTIGFKYSLGFQLGLCRGPVDEITKIEADDKVAWTGSITANATGTIAEPELFGGKSSEGGIEGDFDICMGAAAQTVNSYLEAEQGTPLPAYRGTCCLVWKGGYIGNSKYVKPWAVTARRVLAGWYNDAPWYSAAALVGEGMNPAHILYQCITDPDFGMGKPSSDIDDTAFQAAADTLKTEGLGLSLLWVRESRIEDFMQVVLDHIHAVLTWNPFTGQYSLRLVRDDYDAETLDTYGPETISRITSLQWRGWGETVNELALGYTDATTRAITPIYVQDLGNIASQGERIPEYVALPGITDADVAARVAGRELLARSTPVARITFEADRRLWSTRVGDVLKVSWPAYDLTDLVVRVLKIAPGSLDNGAVMVEGVEDIYARSPAIYTGAQAAASDPTPPALPDDADADPSVVISATETLPPVSGLVDGDRYYVPLEAGGAWTDHAGDIAEWDAIDEAWTFITPDPGTILYVQDVGQHFLAAEVGPGGATSGAVPQPAPWAGEAVAECTIVDGGITIDLRLARYFVLLLDQHVTSVEFLGLSQDKVQWWTLRVEYVGTSDQASFAIPADWRFPAADGEYVPTVADGAFDLLHGIRWPDMVGWMVLHKTDFQ